MVKKSIYYICTLFFMLCISACGKDKDIEKFNESMSKFLTNIQMISDEMTGIDAASDTAVLDMLSCLDKFEAELILLAETEVPDEFASVKELSEQARDNMIEANRLYHEVYSDPDADLEALEDVTFDEEKANAALEYYNRAMTRISYISLILQGETPEGENIEIINEEATDFEPIDE